ncbi:hypothetical protein Tco_1553902 [Tanacetum coccineum]
MLVVVEQLGGYEGGGCSDKLTPLELKMIHKLRVDLERCHSHRNHVLVIDYLIVVDESVDVNWQSEKKYVNSFDVTVITYGYIKNHKKIVKSRQARTRERKSEQKPEAKPGKVNPQSKWSNHGQQKST